ncbi:MAG: hypothetical protein H0T89_02335 [Deltaproteobacteria bacterium]|nr:hypothetical protein [Deltaproteobacteria bacterium]MDQ3298702.1 hypothetical protein [Myxococcota bacterium]
MNRTKHIEYVFDDASELYRRLKDTQPYAVVFAREEHATLVCAALSAPCVRVTSRADFLAECTKRGAIVAFVDLDLLAQSDGQIRDIAIIGLIDDEPAATLPTSIISFDRYSWLSHLITTTMLVAPLARAHLQKLLERVVDGPEHDMIGTAGVGRVALLARASRRDARFERMAEFFTKQGLSTRATSVIAEVAEELVMNALYDAPVESGYFEQAIPRTEDVDLPVDRACEISYGMDEGNVFIRVRDPFGALSRERLLEVLNRCSAKSVGLDESRGGAGLGLWRVFSSASTIAITVVPGRITDIVVGIATKNGRVVKNLLAIHLFFHAKTISALDAVVSDDQEELLDRSITLIHVA